MQIGGNTKPLKPQPGLAHFYSYLHPTSQRKCHGPEGPAPTLLTGIAKSRGLAYDKEFHGRRSGRTEKRDSFYGFDLAVLFKAICFSGPSK